jgi:hypothetical protein
MVNSVDNAIPPVDGVTVIDAVEEDDNGGNDVRMPYSAYDEVITLPLLLLLLLPVTVTVQRNVNDCPSVMMPEGNTNDALFAIDVRLLTSTKPFTSIQL